MNNRKKLTDEELKNIYPTYWDAFLIKYKNEITNQPLKKILEAFYYYCESDNPICEKSDKIMGRIRGNMPYEI